ncbi:hypothetical protein ACSAZK_03505 [Methanosarcina sp. Mfa9]|uniref:hypothetical protein n=1 Tax=Methanosarcina sp. Mfa9 TaxID=3439063 RepID=UPI003F841F89
MGKREIAEDGKTRDCGRWENERLRKMGKREIAEDGEYEEDEEDVEDGRVELKWG